MNMHFLELKKRIIYCFFFVIIVFLSLFYHSDVLYDIFSHPIVKYLNGNNLIATKITSIFFVPLKLSFIISIVISLPYIMIHFWIFISPGLYSSEKKTLFPFLIFSSILFYIGLLFAFYIVLPIAISFFISNTPSNVIVMADISSYIDFMFTIMLSCGIGFQTPIIINFIIKVNLFSKKELSDRRPYIIVMAFIIGMLLTPPDVISQIMLALPIWLLFELGLILTK